MTIFLGGCERVVGREIHLLFVYTRENLCSARTTVVFENLDTQIAYRGQVVLQFTSRAIPL